MHIIWFHHLEILVQWKSYDHNRVVIPFSDSQRAASRIPKHQNTIATPSLAAKAKRHQNDVQAQTALKGIDRMGATGRNLSDLYVIILTNQD